MKRFFTLITIAALSLQFALAMQGCSANEQSIQGREFRGGWIHIVGNTQIKDMTRQQVQDMFVEVLDSMQTSGCNAVIFQVRPCADAFYKSEVEPWSRYLSGAQGVAPAEEWDPMQFMIDESHKRGMEFHAWCNPYRVTLLESDTLCADHVYFKHPEIFVKHGKQLYFNPAEPLSRELTVKAIADIVNRYDIEAVHFDDYFYPYPITGVEFNDTLAFEKYATQQGFVVEGNKDAQDSLGQAQYQQSRKQVLGDWRRHNVELLIKELNDTIKASKPWVRFGISPFGIHRNKKDTPDSSGSNTNGLSNYDQLFADVPGWAERGIIDYYVPQLYWEIGHRLADYETLIHWWNDTWKRGHLYIGQSISSFRKPDLDNPEINQTAAKMKLVRELPNVYGNVWWPAWSLVRNQAGVQESMRTTYQKNPALIPAYSWLDSTAPAAVKGLKAENGKLVWSQNPKDEQDPMQKALFYAVYYFPAGVDADKENKDCLIKLVPDAEFDVAANPAHAEGGKYVVTVVDRCWNESKGSVVAGF
ncbi:MAG: family 10 glycosylhydrolase [Bacteroidales bacterium]|nr:family 10 glycosylhydrolase [Bacteroidales bacterium]